MAGGRPGTGDLTPRHAAHVIRTIDAVCDDAPSSELPFEVYAALDELGAHLADWLRQLAPDPASGLPRAT